MCALFTHGQGWELRLVVDGDLARSTVCGSQDEGLATAEDWERQLREDETCTSDPSTPALWRTNASTCAVARAVRIAQSALVRLLSAVAAFVDVSD